MSSEHSLCWGRLKLGLFISSHNSDPEIIRAGIRDERFRKIVFLLATEIHILGETEEQLSNDVDLDMLAIELSSLLSELNCPYENLTCGSVADRFYSERGSLQLLDYLTAELMSLQMYQCNRQSADQVNVIELQETLTADALKRITSLLALGQPPAAVASTDLFNRLSERIDRLLKTVGRSRIGKPLIGAGKSWSVDQWTDLEKRHVELDQEYDLRREMLLTRLDCTVQAFNWSERLKPKQGQILGTYRAKLDVLETMLKGGSNTDIVALLAARDLLLAIEKASSAAVLKNTKSKIQRHIIGSVPDRGGRAWEHAAPAPEMPSWQKQRATRGRGGGGRGNHHRGGGGNHHRGRGGESQGFQQNRGHDQQGQNINYDANRGAGSRVQSGWSQRGRGRGHNNN